MGTHTGLTLSRAGTGILSQDLLIMGEGVKLGGSGVDP